MSDDPEQPAAEVSVDPEESDVEHFRFRVSKNLTRRIDQYLVDRVGYLSRAGVQRLIDDGLVKVNGRVDQGELPAHARATTVEMVAPPEPVNELVPEPIPLDIVYEDEHFLALNKQADLIVHPARGRWTGTLVNGLVLLRQEVEHDQRRLAAGHPAPARPQHHRHHARRQERRGPLAARPAVREPHDPEDLHGRLSTACRSCSAT